MKTRTIKILILLSLLLPPSALSAGVVVTENRCGWLSNPTPANIWLTDRDGSWDIMIQGHGLVTDDEASGNNLPSVDYNDRRYIRFNGNYGFSCACLNGTVDKEQSRFKIITSGKIVELKQCLEDPDIAAKMPLLN